MTMKSKYWLMTAILLVVIATVAAQCVVAPAPQPAAETGAQQAAVAPDKPFAGVNLTLLMHPTLYDVTGGDEGLVKEFEEETGATVEVVKADIQTGLEKLTAEFLAGSGRYDVFNVEQSWFNPDFFTNLEPLDGYIANLDPAYDYEDLIPSLVEIGKFEGKTYGIPFRIGTTMLYYRQDLLEEKGLKPPANYEELMAVAKALTEDLDGDGKIDVYGFAMRGKELEIQHDYLQVLYAMGGSVLSPDWKTCTGDQEPSVQTIQLFADLYQGGYVAPDTLAWGRDDMIAAIQQGRAAMGIMYSPYWGRLVDPEQSKFVDQMGWAFVPTAPGVPEGRTRVGGWHLAMDKNSKNKEAGWELIKKLTNKEGQLFMALEHANGPIRASAYNSPEYLEKFPLAKDWLASTAASVADPNQPRFAEMRDVMSALIPLVMQGDMTAQEAATEYCNRVNTILAE
jgi:multiple sugar transport system substrate-binding protein